MRYIKVYQISWFIITETHIGSYLSQVSVIQYHDSLIFNYYFLFTLFLQFVM